MRYTYNKKIKSKISELIDKMESMTIYNTKQLIDEIKNIGTLNYKKLNEIAYRIEMLDRYYTFELKENIKNKAEIIKLNNLDKKNDNDKIVKEELIDEITEIAYCYGICIE